MSAIKKEMVLLRLNPVLAALIDEKSPLNKGVRGSGRAGYIIDLLYEHFELKREDLEGK